MKKRIKIKLNKLYISQSVFIKHTTIINRRSMLFYIHYEIILINKHLDIKKARIISCYSVRFIRSSNGSLDYENKFSRVFHADSTIMTSHTYNKLTDWGREFLKNGGLFGVETTTGMQLLGMLNMGYLEDGETPEVRTVDANYKVIEKAGTLYWERSLLNSMVGTDMLRDEQNKTFYYGSEEFITKKLQEMEKTLKMDDSFNNGKTYMETMDDLFKDVEEYKPVK